MAMSSAAVSSRFALRALVLLFLSVQFSPVLADSWSYHARVDPMTSATTDIAVAQSSNALSLDFPYQGRTYARLYVRRSKQLGIDVYIVVDRGQLICSYDDCSVLV